MEFCYQRVFGTVCGDGNWATVDAQVVCRQFGYPIEGKVVKISVARSYPQLYFVHTLLIHIGATALRVAAVFGPGTGRVWVNNPQCTLSSTSLANCTFGVPLGNSHSCGHANDAGVICFTEFGMWLVNIIVSVVLYLVSCMGY